MEAVKNALKWFGRGIVLNSGYKFFGEFVGPVARNGSVNIRESLIIPALGATVGTGFIFLSENI